MRTLFQRQSYYFCEASCSSVLRDTSVDSILYERRNTYHGVPSVSVPIYVEVGCPVLKSQKMKAFSPHFLTPSSSAGSKNSASSNGSVCENVGCSLLHDKYNKNIFDQLGDNCFTLVTGIVELLQGDMEARTWNKLDMGAICYVRDYGKKKCSMRLIDYGINNNPPAEKWRINLPAELEFVKNHSHLITFTSSDEKQYGLNFSLESDAENFFNRAQQLQNERREKKAAKKKSKSPWFGRKRENKIPEEQSSEDRSQQENTGNSGTPEKDKPEVAPQIEKQKSGVFSPFTKRMDSAFTSLTNFVDSKAQAFRKDKTKKEKKKSKVSKLDISGPSNFKHKAHMGDSPFCDDTDIEQTVREVYRALELDYNKAPKKEIEAVRRKVSRYGGENIRRSMRNKAALRKSQANGTVGTTDGAQISPTSFNRIQDAQNSIRFPPRDSWKTTPTSLKRIDVRRRESGKSDYSDTYPRNPPKARPPLPAKKPNNVNEASQQRPNQMNGRLEWSISAGEMRSRPPVASKPTGYYAVSSIVHRSESDELQETSEPSTSHIEQPTCMIRTIIQNERKPKMSGGLAVTTTGTRSDTAVGYRNISSSTGSESSPPPPPPLPPSASNNASRNVPNGMLNTGRSDLLEAIRNADKSSLRKVSAESNVRTPQTPHETVDAGNLIDAIGLMIEKRRQRIASSDEEDEEESDDDEEWFE